jgi:uncharacterized protein (TIGR02001 family)
VRWRTVWPARLALFLARILQPVLAVAGFATLFRVPVSHLIQSLHWPQRTCGYFATQEECSMKLTHGLAAIVLMGSAAAANAELTGTVTAVSDYDFRGGSLSATDPALQGSIDWSMENGFYAGAWASNIDYGRDVDGDIEVDLYAGFAGGSEDGLGWDVGLVWYMYPGADDIDDYPELYAGLTYSFFEFKQWYTNDVGGTDDDGFYTEANASFELPAAFTLNLHAGYNYGAYFDESEYVDYSVGVGYTLGNFDLELKWVDNNLGSSDWLYTEDDVFNTEGRAIFAVSTTFPWSKE